MIGNIFNNSTTINQCLWYQNCFPLTTSGGGGFQPKVSQLEESEMPLLYKDFGLWYQGMIQNHDGTLIGKKSTGWKV